MTSTNCWFKPQAPCGGKEATTDIQGQPVRVCSVLVRCDPDFTLWVYQWQNRCFTQVHTDWQHIREESALTNKWISLWHIQYVIIPDDRHTYKNTFRTQSENESTMAQLLRNEWVYRIRAMSSMRPPFPLYKQEALIPSLLLATDSRSDKVP